MSASWIKVDTSLSQSALVHNGAQELGISPLEMQGLLVNFWAGLSLAKRGGLVSDLPDTLIEQWAGYVTRDNRLAQFLRAHHLDARGRVKDWWTWAGAREREARHATQRKQKQRVRARARSTRALPEILTVLADSGGEAELDAGGHGDGQAA